MTDRILVLLAAINMMLAVAAGAFGAHGLKTRVDADLIAVWNTGVLYHLVHGLGLLALALLLPRLGSSLIGLAGWLMLAGIVLFSGSLYTLVLTGTRVLGAITPLGGVAFIAAWAVVAWAACRQ
ncbi:MAG: DUF423 domain-containing protein [Pigmentiphaga sp.]|nr:DUF423 domain-containing protein [Pigmentiphaga sp.]